MTKFFTSLPRHLLAALKSLKRHLAMTLSSASAVAVTLILLALFLVLAVNISDFTKHVETNLKIHAAIDSLQTKKQIADMKKEVQSMPGVTNVIFSSKENELNILIKESGSVFARYKDHNPMPNVFIVEVKEASQIPVITKKLNALTGIEKAQYGGESINNMIKTFSTVRYGGAIFILALGILAIFLISNTIKMTIYTRNTEISIMRNVGANNWYIRMPFMFEGMFIGILGAVVPILIITIGYGFLYDSLGGHFMTSMFIMQAPSPFVWKISGVLVGCGAIVGIIGSFLAVTKYLRWKR